MLGCGLLRIRFHCFSHFKRHSLVSRRVQIYNIKQLSTSFPHLYKMDIITVTSEFEKFAPLSSSEAWDNVGLLVQPSPKPISSIIFTNDLTTKVLQEAVDARVDMIYSYHPPIFTPLKRLTAKDWKQNIILTCIEKGIAVYSPHTALDACQDGVNDWLISGFDLESVKPLQQTFDDSLKYSHQVDVVIPANISFDAIKSIPGLNVLSTSFHDEVCNLKILVDGKSLIQLTTWLTQENISSFSVSKLEKIPLLNCGMGRFGKLNKPLRICDAITVMKKHIGVQHLRVSFGNKHEMESSVSTVAVCAGSGSSILKGTNAELCITGEMSHHDLLDNMHKGITVILCEHSNSERGFLTHLVNKLKVKLPGIKLFTSETDADPVVIL